jgi:hypothetical protein
MAKVVLSEKSSKCLCTTPNTTPAVKIACACAFAHYKLKFRCLSIHEKMMQSFFFLKERQAATLCKEGV